MSAPHPLQDVPTPYPAVDPFEGDPEPGVIERHLTNLNAKRKRDVDFAASHAELLSLAWESRAMIQRWKMANWDSMTAEAIDARIARWSEIIGRATELSK